ncbi:PAS domain S-box protein [Oceanospirillum sediminis]|uniref:PAS domain S-box protein n=1 Tax=Oceanospirillum sediminis TaxID=2760088 RepID=A0A839IUD6_9GAMM|nr:PAS domain S-box protein [Oceanospirillum sediminis]MBB1488551.1 PAS domain S-box protein [Oceanospirillum sediminis]
MTEIQPVPRILIAEDDITTQMILSRFIEQQGYQAICAQDGEEALTLSRLHSIDLALVDANMPGMDGFQCCHALTEQYSAQLPVLIVTALEDEASIDRAFESGAIDFISKPIQWAVLRNRMKYLLANNKARQELQSSEARKASLINNAIDAIISINNRGRILDFNPAATALFGFEKNEIADSVRIEHLLPDFHQLIHKKLVQTHIDKDHSPKRYEALAINKSGDNFTVEVALFQHEVHGEMVTTIMLHDITERKRFQDELQLASTVFNFCNEGIIITDKDNIVEAVNPSFSEITGFAPAEVIGQNPSMLQSGEQDGQFYQQMWQDIEHNGSWQGEIVNKRQDGSLYHEWLSVRTVFDHTGTQARNYVAIFSDISERKKAEQEIWWRAHHDSLTGLPNRSMFMQSLKRKLDTADELHLFFVDLDGFKAVNDTLGHHSGDLVLKEAASRLKQALPEEAMIARLGGDEFTVIVEKNLSADQLLRLGNRIIELLSQGYLCDDRYARLSASIGIASSPRHATNADALISVADQLMYDVKHNGKSGVLYAD